jgi:hypothetical protein
MRLYRQRKKAQDPEWEKRMWSERKRRDPDISRKKYRQALARDPDFNLKKRLRKRELQIQRGQYVPHKNVGPEQPALTKAERRKKRISRIVERQRERYLEDHAYAMQIRLRGRMAYAMRASSTKKSARTLALVGCSRQELAAHIQSLFKPGMSWDNRREWHIDHIIPCSAFDLTTEQGQRAAFHYTNLQPLWAKDNLRKSKKPPVAQRRFSFGYVMLADELRTGRRREARRRKGDVPNLQPPGPAQ